MVQKAAKGKMRISRTIKTRFVSPLQHLCGGKGSAQKYSGFTLIELLVVVALIGLLASAAGSLSIGTYKRMLVEKAAKQVYLAAKYARLLAVEKQTYCSLVLDEENRAFCLMTSDSMQTDEDEEVSGMLVSDAYSKPTQFGGDVKFEQINIMSSYQIESETDSEKEGQEQTIMFYPDGTADAAALQVGDENSHYAIYVMPATGKAKVIFGEAEETPVETVDLDMEEQ